MARHIRALNGALIAASDRSTRLGFLATWLVLSCALATTLPLFKHEAQIIGQVLIGREPTQSLPLLAGWLVQLGEPVFGFQTGLRLPFIGATLIGALLSLRIANHLGVGPVVTNLGLAWSFSSLLMIGGGVLVGPGPLALVGMTLFALALHRLAHSPSRLSWCAVGAALAIMIVAVPELALVAASLVMLPFVHRPCRRWPLRAEFWIVTAGAGILAILAARLNGMSMLWPAFGLQIPDGWASAVILLLVSPPLVLATGWGLIPQRTQASAHPMRAICRAITLTATICFVGSGFDPVVLFAVFPLLTLQAAALIDERSGQFAAWLSEHTLPFSAVAMLAALYLWATGAPLLMHQTAVFRDASGWTALAWELDALADQNGLAWIATDTTETAALIRQSATEARSVVVAATSTRTALSCGSPGLFVAQTQPDMVPEPSTGLRPITRWQDGIARATYVVTLVQSPQRLGLCLTE